jgi:hypothetical protein
MAINIPFLQATPQQPDRNPLPYAQLMQNRTAQMMQFISNLKSMQGSGGGSVVNPVSRVALGAQRAASQPAKASGGNELDKTLQLLKIKKELQPEQMTPYQQAQLQMEQLKMAQTSQNSQINQETDMARLALDQQKQEYKEEQDLETQAGLSQIDQMVEAQDYMGAARQANAMGNPQLAQAILKMQETTLPQSLTPAQEKAYQEVQMKGLEASKKRKAAEIDIEKLKNAPTGAKYEPARKAAISGQLIGIDSETYQQMQDIEAMASKYALENQFSGPQSDKDVELARQMTVSMDKTPEQNIQAVKMKAAMMQRDEEYAIFQEKWRRKHNGDMTGVFEAFNSYVNTNPLFKKEKEGDVQFKKPLTDMSPFLSGDKWYENIDPATASDELLAAMEKASKADGD